MFAKNIGNWRRRFSIRLDAVTKSSKHTRIKLLTGFIFLLFKWIISLTDLMPYFPVNALRIFKYE